MAGPLDRIVRRALAPDPGRRYGSAAEMRDDLAQVPESAGVDDLPAEERYWLRATALMQTLATSAALWAFLLSVTPRLLPPGDVSPLIMLKTERTPDGRILSWARFETWPILASVGLAVAAQGLLRHHWRRAGLERSTPARALQSFPAGVCAPGRLPPGPRYTSRMFDESAQAFLALPANSPVAKPLAETLLDHGVQVSSPGSPNGPTVPSEQIHTTIRRADFVVADLTDKNPNVIFEIGLAMGMGMGKPVLLLSQESSGDLPFDLRAQQVVIYRPEKVGSVRRYLDLWLRDVMARRKALAAL